MATQKSAKKSIAASQPTVAVRLANAFDKGKAKLAQDMAKPVERSRSKQTAIVGGLLGIGAALGVAFS
jgi:hypothetical protein